MTACILSKLQLLAGTDLISMHVNNSNDGNSDLVFSSENNSGSVVFYKESICTYCGFKARKMTPFVHVRKTGT